MSVYDELDRHISSYVGSMSKIEAIKLMEHNEYKLDQYINGLLNSVGSNSGDLYSYAYQKFKEKGTQKFGSGWDNFNSWDNNNVMYGKLVNAPKRMF